MDISQLGITRFEDLEKINPFTSIPQKRGNLIQTKNLKKLCDESLHFLHGVDYLRGVLCDKEQAQLLRSFPIFGQINDTNSDFMAIEGYSPFYVDAINKKHFIPFGRIGIQKTKCTEYREKYVFSIVHEDVPCPLMEINFYFGENTARIMQNGVYCSIELKGRPFRLEVATAGAFKPFYFLQGVLLSGVAESSRQGGGYVYNFYKDDFELTLAEILGCFKLTRIDYRFDFFLPKGHFGLKDTDIFRNLRSTNANYSGVIYEKKLGSCPYGVRTRRGRNYTGWKNGNSSRYIQTRFYQKQVDTWLKGLAWLYPEYMNFDGEVRRLEFQFESKFCNARTKPGERYNFYDEFEDKALTKQIFEFVGVSEKKGLFCQKYEPVTVDLKKQPYSYQRRFFSRYMHDSVKLVDSGINPLELIDRALSLDQKERMKELRSKDKIDNAFYVFSPDLNL